MTKRSTKERMEAGIYCSKIKLPFPIAKLDELRSPPGQRQGLDIDAPGRYALHRLTSDLAPNQAIFSD